MSSPPYSLVWLRRDLRLHDHAAFSEALTSPGAVQPVFIFDRAILARFSDPHDRRLTFIAQTLIHLHRQLKEQGGRLLVYYGHAVEIIPALARVLGVAQVVAEEDYEPGTIVRDDTVRKALHGQVRFVQVIDHVIQQPAAVLKDNGEPYKVFTPYSKAWRARLMPHSFDEKKVALGGRLSDAAPPEIPGAQRLDPEAGAEAMLAAMGYREVAVTEWTVTDARQRVSHFAHMRLAAYKDRRDFVADEGTSKLSPYLRFGLVSVRECARAAVAVPGKGSDGWVNELIWREFYMMILYHFPDTPTQEFQEPYRGLNWQRDEVALQRWKDGMTGYPIVDAAMRQLKTTGWMHNRARMIVASFLTKDLLIDWRLGEEHFAHYLMDYELASNVGGWQWAASTGTDAQPYFRIFNPELQSLKFDPAGDYIRRFVPELAALPSAQIHNPHKHKDLFARIDYPEPMVDHHVQKDKALALFKGMKDSAA